MAPPWVPQFWDHPTRKPCTVRSAPHGADIFASEHLVVGRKQLLEKTSANPKDGLIMYFETSRPKKNMELLKNQEKQMNNDKS